MKNILHFAIRCLPCYVLFLLGCSTTVHSVNYWGETSQTDKIAPFQYHDRFDRNLHVLEFNENGRLWREGQLINLQKSIASTEKPPIVILYIHGWKHNAHPENANLVDFSRFLPKLRGQDVFSEFEVIGVYLGWRGLTADGAFGWLEKLLSYNSRERVADEIGSSQEFADTVYGLTRNADMRNGHSILLGHSLGGRIIETAAVRDQNSESVLGSSLAFLFNPATDRSQTIKLQDLYSKLEKPALVLFGARNDRAIRSVYPIASFFTVKDRDGINISSAAAYDPGIVTHHLDNAGEVIGLLTITRNELVSKRAVRKARLFRSRKSSIYRLYSRNAEEAFMNSVEGRQAYNLAAQDSSGLVSQRAVQDLIRRFVVDREGVGSFAIHDALNPVTFRFFPIADEGTWTENTVVMTSASPDRSEGISGYLIVSVSPTLIHGHGNYTSEDGIFDSSIAIIISELFGIRLAG